jgi:O-acetyl-ADP-ribose deacetylase (regulator of RNase III)
LIFGGETTQIALKTVSNFLEDERNRKNIKRIIFVLYEKKVVSNYYNFLPIYFSYLEIKVNL